MNSTTNASAMFHLLIIFTLSHSFSITHTTLKSGLVQNTTIPVKSGNGNDSSNSSDDGEMDLDYDDSKSSSSFQPFVILMSSSGEAYRTTNTSADIKRESYYHSNDPIISAFIYGLWLFYSKPNFNWGDMGDTIHGSTVEWVFYADGPKLYNFSSEIHSFRPVGDPDDFRSSSVTLFLGKNYTGPNYITLTTDYPNMPYSKSKSLIVTGNDNWHMYSSANFVQKNLCVVPVNGIAMIADFYLRKTTHAMRHVNSMKKGGCVPSKAAKNTVYYGLDGVKHSTTTT